MQALRRAAGVVLNITESAGPCYTARAVWEGALQSGNAYMFQSCSE